MNKLLLLSVLLAAGPATLAQSAVPTTPASTSQSAAITPAAALTRLAQARALDPRWFVAAFASALPQVQGGFQGFVSQYGAFQGVDALGGDVYRLRYAGGTVTVSAQVNAAGQFTSLFLQDQQATAAPAATTSPSAMTPQAALTRLFSASAPSADWFSPAFLQQVPLSQLAPILAQASGNLGAFQSVAQGPDGTFTLKFAQGELPVKTVSLDAQGRFTSLLLGVGVPNQKPSLADVLAAFKALPGQTSLAVIENGKLVGSLNPDSKLAVGSAFKLGILAELLSQMNTGQHQWSEVTTLQASDKALPSGFLQTWPDASPLTLQTLATLMISQSDNTAADVLLRLVGRQGVGQRLGLTVVPSTRELFALKNPANKALLETYLNGNDEQKQTALLQAASAPLPPASLFAPGAVVAPQVEWFTSVRTLCDLMNQVAVLPLTRVNPGVADPALFKSVSFKGGSEGGVVNLTTQVTTTDGRTVCLSATSNDNQGVDQNRFIAAYNQLLQAVR